MLTVTKLISNLLAITLIASVGNALQDSPIQPVRLQKFSRDLDWLREEELLQIGFRLFPLDKDTALLYGSLGNGAATFGTLMLRSEDGGRNWTEVMAPVRGSGIWEVTCTESGLLWALVVWQTESPAEIRLYKSEDKGKTWRHVSKVPKRYYDGAPENLRFTDDKHGRIEMYYGDHAGPKHEGMWTMETKDGGRTWRDTGRITLADYEERQKKEEESKDSSSEVVRGWDGSEWKLVWEGGLIQGKPVEPEHIDICRRLPGEISWSTMRTVARDFEVSGMEIIERQVKK